MLDRYLPNIQTPKESIVALDVEDGTPNTDAVLYALDKIQKAGYTAMLYGYKSFLTSHLNLKAISDKYPLWLAEYPDYNVTAHPNYRYFPSWDNIAIFQFTSTYVAGGLDGNIDLTGITDNGYKNGQAQKPKSSSEAIEDGLEADDTPKKEIAAGYTVKVNFKATNWATGESIPTWVKGRPYQVQQTKGDQVLLANINSWISRKDVEILATDEQNHEQAIKIPEATTNQSEYVVKAGDTLSQIAISHGTNWQELARINKLSNPSLIYTAQILKLPQAQAKKYIVKSGDTLEKIAKQLQTTVQHLLDQNPEIINPNLIWPKQVLNY